ncbi:MAG: hypothetical protein H6581_15550 [Bacteroidia bacterium]|nr:hypothetical protein [Bacteroidia bacterium]
MKRRKFNFKYYEMSHLSRLFLTVLGAATLLILISAFQPKPHKHKPMLTFQPGDTYEDLWKKVDSLKNQGLPESALEVVNLIYGKASQDHNDAQVAKSLIHVMLFTAAKEEESIVKNIGRMEEEIKKAHFPLKPVLQSMLAESYYSYYSNNYWRFQNRSETVSFDNLDIRTWDLTKVRNEIYALHQAALENRDSLKRTPLSLFNDILQLQTGSQDYRGTLFDFLAHRAISFYSNDLLQVNQPAWKFDLDQEEVFLPAKQFAKLQITTRDTGSNKYNAFLLYQDLVDFHLGDTDPMALIDLERNRLTWMRSHSVLGYADSLYLQALVSLEKTYPNHPEIAQVGYDIARHLNEQGGQYTPGSEHPNRWKIRDAWQKCAEVIKTWKAENPGVINCKSLQIEIETTSISVTHEEVNLPGQPCRALVTYDNVPKLYLKLARLEPQQWDNLSNIYDEQKLEALKKLPVVKEWSQDLPLEGDYQSHLAEIEIPGLELGEYVLLASSSNEFVFNEHQISFSRIWYSNLSYSARLDNKYDMSVLVQDRESGEPLKGAKVRLLNREYDYNSRLYRFIEKGNYTTDDQGWVKIPAPSSGSRYFNLEVRNGKDRLSLNDSYSQYYSSNNSPQSVLRTTFFMDRMIYRPGQTIYFKGLVLEFKGENASLKTNYKTTVYFIDPNYQTVSTLEVTTNEYGTFSGTFTAPLGQLNGQFHLQDGNSSQYFRVEDYKRPKFEVKFEPVKGSFALGGLVKVKGNALAYAGSTIDDAKVAYRVVRQTRFPWCWGWRWYPSTADMEITSGEVKTDAAGDFEIEFNAIPDKSVSSKYLPQFNFIVYADVTDVSGETHSTQTYVNVGYVALNADLVLPAQLDKDTKYKGFAIRTTNLNGQFEPAKGSISLQKLRSPNRLMRNRLWAKPDMFVMKKEEFLQKFPLDIYDNEADHTQWEVEKEVFKTQFDTEKDDSLQIPGLKDFAEGMYKAILKTKDKFGKEVSKEYFVQVFQASGKKVALPVMSTFVDRKVMAEPGEKASIQVGTAAQKVKVLCEVEWKGTVVKQEWITLNNEKINYEQLIPENYRGNFSLNFHFVRHGRRESHQRVVTVPWTNKQLKLEFETFRDKLEPGAKEEWKVKIAGPGGEMAAAEMVAAMYDASLDAFAPNYFSFSCYPIHYSYLNWQHSSGFSSETGSILNHYYNRGIGYRNQSYDYLNWFGYTLGYNYFNYRYKSVSRSGAVFDAEGDFGGAELEESGNADGWADDMDKDAPAPMEKSVLSKESAEDETLSAGENRREVQQKNLDGKLGGDQGEVSIRTNLNETAFFFPHLRTNEKGEVIFSFTMPEALTRWKFLGFAHTKDLKYGQMSGETVTQKELMVMPHRPRFFRENDRIVFTAKVSNLAENALNGTAKLELYNALNMEPVDAIFGNSNSSRNFSVEKGRSTGLEWELTIPEGVQAVTYRVIARAGNHSDGEEDALPVLTNRMLVTEGLPLPLRPRQKKDFTFTKLVENKSTTLKHQKITLEFTSNPAWYAVQALPYLMEYPYECAEQTFSRFYANSLATHVANSHPRIKQVFESWKNTDKEALLSNLEKNQELKYLLLEEMPWVLNAQDETERKKRVGLLFDLNKMASELESALKKLQKSQASNGGWPWFPGMPDNRYITQHIATGLGHLDHLGVKNVREDSKTWTMTQSALRYLDDRIREDYELLLRYKADLSKNHLGQLQCQYLYARSYFKDVPVSKQNQVAFDYYLKQAETYWLDQGKYTQGMIALALHRYEKPQTPAKIIKSLKEHSLKNEEMGMYWADNTGGWYWYQAPIETQALLIEAFDEVANDQASVEEMKLWLLKQKQTTDWKTTKATAEACYALLLRGTDLLAESKLAEITMGGQKIDPTTMEDVKVEAGTGYFKTSWTGKEITQDLGKISVNNPNNVAAWGAVYWQYFEQLDKITFAETPLKLSKELFREEMTDRGPILRPLKAGAVLTPGDKVKVRIEIRTDRDLEYVHLKDMRASGFEPINVLSQYKYQDGLGYYESTRDAATNFFISWLGKGTYVFEYPLRVSHKGDFSNGITTIQCMYAPEFTAHSEGVRVVVK